jgi:hypothetical protein
VLLAVAVLIVLAALAAVLLFAKRGGREQVTVAHTIVQTTSANSSDGVRSEPATTSSPEDQIPLAAIQSLLGQYESAYSNEDLAGLRGLFTDDLVRLPGNGPPQDLAGALATYRDQFSQLDNPVYELSNVRAASNSTEAQAVGRYLITDAGSRAGSGRIVFHMVTLGDELYIDRLDITPSG